MNINLSKFQDQAYRAFSGTSFSPERRAQNTISEFAEQLKSDIDELQKAGVDEAEIDSYQKRYEQHFSTWLAKKSNCISSMIAGPSNFPVRRAQKANRSEENHWSLWMEWRKRAKKAIIRKSQPAKTYESEIDRYKKDLAGMVNFQESAKEINKIVRAQRKSKEEKAFQLCEKFGYSINEANVLLEPDFAGRVGIPSYRLTNNNANMKRVEARIKELEAKESLKQAATGGEKEVPFEGGVLVLNYELDRVQIKFPGKPAPEVISRLKSGGFRWAPSQSAWQRQLTGNGLYAARMFTGISFEDLKK